MPAPSARSPDFDDENFLEFERSLGLEPAYSKTGVCARLGKSESSVDLMIRSGELRAFRVGGSKLTFLGRDLAVILYRNQITPTPLPEQQRSKPFVKRTPPDPVKGVEARRKKQRGRPRTSPISKLEERA